MRRNIERYVNHLAETVVGQTQLSAKQEPDPLESVLRGLAVELWSDTAGRLFIVADEADAQRLDEPRGTVYTAAELRRVVKIADSATVLEIHEWKRRFDARVRESSKKGESLTT